MKIGFVFDDSLDRLDGVQQQLRLLGKWLSDNSHQVVYICGETKSSEIDGLPVVSLGRNFTVHANQNQLTLPLPIKKRSIRAVFNDHNFDVLHVMLPFSPFLGGKVISEAAKRNIPLVGTFHTYPASKLQSIGSQVYGWIIKSKLKRFAGLVSVSSATKDSVRSLFGVDTLIIPNGVDLKRFRTAQPNQKIIQKNKQAIIFLGRLVERKGPGLLLQALGILNQSNALESVDTYICGHGPLRQTLESQVIELKLEKKVQFTDFVPEAGKPSYLASADLAVFPSTGGEAFGIVLVEAMSAGALTLGGDNEGYRTILGERPELLVNPENSQEFANKIEQLLNDEKLRNDLLDWQARKVSKYDISIIGPKYVELYNLVSIRS